MQLEKYSFGVGDRFAQQGVAQLSAIIEAKRLGVNVVPVWNKSHREHAIVKSDPDSVRRKAEQAVEELDWKDSYYIDADHINADNVDEFIESSNFFTLDVAEYIGKCAPDVDIENFVKKYSSYIGQLNIEGIYEPITVTEELIRETVSKTLLAITKAAHLYRHIESKKGKAAFVTEVSMDETEDAQTPIEMLFILAAVADLQIPVQTIAPKFTGRFNKGVDYVGDANQFEKEFEQDVAVIRYAIKEFGLPKNLKLSIHSGSDKFSIYESVNRVIRKYDAGLHVKTAGTTWLEEIIGLAAAGGKGLEVAKSIYKSAYARFDELCKPYAAVVDIDKAALPLPEIVDAWTSKKFKDTVTHDSSCPDYCQNVRQLLHVGYKVAAEMGDKYIETLQNNADVIAGHVKENLFERHIKPIFLSEVE